MVEMVVSRFLYVLCWRNKIAIILIILSGSMGMLLMLSFYGTKQPGSVDELLLNGKGRMPTIMKKLASQNLFFKDQLAESTNKDHRLGNPLLHRNNAEMEVNILKKEIQKLPNRPEKNLTFGEQNKDSWVKHFDTNKNIQRDKVPNNVNISKFNKNTPHKIHNRNNTFNNSKQQETTGDKQRNPLKMSNKMYIYPQKIKRDKNLDEHVTLKPKYIDRYSKEKLLGKEVVRGKIGVSLNGKIPERIQNSLKNNRSTVTGNKRQNEYRNKEIRKEKPRNVTRLIIPETKHANEIHLLNNEKNIPKLQGSKARLNSANFSSSAVMNRTELIAALTEQKSKSPLKFKRKIDTLLNVLKKYSSTISDTVSGNEENSVNNNRRNNTDPSIQLVGKRLVANIGKAINSVFVQDEKTGLNHEDKKNEQMPIWHQDHYHRDGIPAGVESRHKIIKEFGFKRPKFEEIKSYLEPVSTKVDVMKSKAEYNPKTENNKTAKTVLDEIVFQKKQTTITPLQLLLKRGAPAMIQNMAPNFSNLFAMAHQHSLKQFKPKHLRTSFRKPGYWPDRLAEWLETEEIYCTGHFKAYNNEFALLKDVIVDRNFCHGRKGGEVMTEVINQPEEEEYYTYFPGFFQLKCPVQPQYFFNSNNHLNQWLYSMTNTRDAHLFSEVRSQFTIAVVRYEYANLYHTMTDWYNAFLLMEFFNKTQAETNILLIDGHPSGALDSVWSVLFNSSQRLSGQSTLTKYSQLAWNILGYSSPIMDHYSPNIPLVEEFRTFFLSSFQMNQEKKLDCDKINILFIWRRDYIAHPRNPTGSISRKIKNEQELVVSLRQNFPLFTVKGIQIDLFDMDQQLQFITNTDILIGMHGAGLTHAFFLPKHAGVIELLPTYWSAANEHFHAIAKWRHLHYRQWTNTDPENEAPDHYTKIPPEVLNSLVTDLVKVVCGLATDPPDTL